MEIDGHVTEIDVIEAGGRTRPTVTVARQRRLNAASDCCVRLQGYVLGYVMSVREWVRLGERTEVCRSVLGGLLASKYTPICSWLCGTAMEVRVAVGERHGDECDRERST
jgi:hypothetical protein